MQFLTFHPKAQNNFKVAIFIKESNLNERLIKMHYIGRLNALGIKDIEIVAFGLKYFNKKVPVVDGRGFLTNNILPLCKKLNVSTCIVADANYFKLLTKKTSSKVLANYTSCVLEGFEKFKVLPVVNYSSFFYQPENESKIMKAYDYDSWIYDSMNADWHSELTGELFADFQIDVKLQHLLSNNIDTQLQ